MTLTALAQWLRCPSCHLALIQRDRLVLGCDNGHRFDANRRGYLTLLPPRHPHVGDDDAMLRARERVLGDGLYSPIRDAVVALAANTATAAPAVADLGCGTGYYLEAVVRSHGVPTATGDTHRPSTPIRALACDLSPAAVSHALRRLRTSTRDADGVEAVDAAGLVADIWQPLPLRDGAATVLLNVFAPRRLEEFARVLSPGGVLVTVVPTERHFAELTASGRALRVPAGKAAQLKVAAETLGTLRADDQLHVEYTMHPDATQRGALSAMGPAARHRDLIASASSAAKDESTEPITVSVDVVRFTRVEPSGQRAK